MSMHAAMCVVAAASLFAAPERKLCVGETSVDATAASCTSMKSATAELPVAPESRVYVWTDAKGAPLAFGVVAAAGGTIASESADAATLSLSLASDEPERWTSPAELRLQQEKHIWRWRMPASKSPKPLRLRLPAGSYTLTASINEHDPVVRSFTVEAREEKPLRLIAAAVPLVRGRVFAGDSEKPVAGALITSTLEKVLATTDGAGRFEMLLRSEEWPEHVRVAATGHGTMIVPMPRIRVSTELPPIRLTPGGRLLLTVDAPASVWAHELRLDVQRMSEAGEPVAVATRVIRQDEIAIPDLEIGTYRLDLRGAAPFERYSQPVELKAAEDVSAKVAIEPRRLLVHSRRGETVLPNAKIEFHHSAGWEGVITTDDRGEAETSFWQEGEFVVFAQSPALASPVFDRAKIEGVDPAEWTLRVPMRRIAGRVVDAADGSAVPEANIALRSYLDGRSVASSLTRSGSDGTFVFDGVPPGAHQFSASATGFLPKENAGLVKVSEPDGDQSLTIRLDRAGSRRVTVIDAAGSPIAGASVIDVQGGRVTGGRMTDQDGDAEVPLRGSDVKTLYVLAPRGSFAVATLAAGGEGALRVVVPPGLGALNIHAETRDHAPAAGVMFLVRFNGQLLPADVVNAMASMHGNRFVSDAAGVVALAHLPAGLYELWPVTSAAQVRRVLSSSGETAPVRVQLNGNEVSSVLTFE